MKRLTHVTLSLALTFLAGCAVANAATPWTPPDSIAGTWEGWAHACGVSRSNSAPESVLVSLTIRSDGIVKGQVGGAVLRTCRVERNRGWIGRTLNLRTDFIIRGGTIDGPVVPGDPETRRAFTLPFNIRDSRLRGSVMILTRWEYPFPMLPGLNLRKAGGEGHR